MKRDLVGYGAHPPDLCWPNQSKLAINFVVNYEEGSELSPVNGDPFAETYGSDFPFTTKAEGERNLSCESFFDYGARVGIWRLLRLFESRGIPLTFFACSQALALNPPLTDYLKHSSHEIAGHGHRWINYGQMDKVNERKQIKECIKVLENLTGQRPLGWYTGRRSKNTLDLLEEIGGFEYHSDSYADELPYWQQSLLTIPYNLHTNDFRFTLSPGLTTAQEFFETLKDYFDCLYREGRTNLMSIGLHPRLSGRPDRCLALERFIDYILGYQDIWLCRRIDIAHYWQEKTQEALKK